jgi:hypothetical protein
MNRWRVGEDRGSKEKDRCPLTGTSVRKDVLRIMARFHRGIHGDVLPRERGNHGTHATRVQITKANGM